MTLSINKAPALFPTHVHTCITLHVFEYIHTISIAKYSLFGHISHCSHCHYGFSTVSSITSLVIYMHFISFTYHSEYIIILLPEKQRSWFRWTNSSPHKLILRDSHNGASHLVLLSFQTLSITYISKLNTVLLETELV